jgi:hypothetical protein
MPLAAQALNRGCSNRSAFPTPKLRELSARRTNVHSLALSRLSYSELGRLTMVLSMLDASLDKAAALAELDVDNEFTEN